MHPRYNTAPVPPDKVKLIQDLMSDPFVAIAWHNYTTIPVLDYSTTKSIRLAKEVAWAQYCKERDRFLGLPPRSNDPKYR